MDENTIIADEETHTEGGSLPRRVWKRHVGRVNTYGISLKAYGVLYDAQRPVPRDELVTKLCALLDPVEVAHLEAWDDRRRQVCTTQNARLGKLRALSTGKERVNDEPTKRLKRRSLEYMVTRWTKVVFDQRVNKTQTLRRDADDRYTPGPTPPWMYGAEGTVVAFTPEMRALQTQLAKGAGQLHALDMELDRLLPLLAADRPTVTDRLIVLGYLLEVFTGGRTDRRRLKGKFQHVTKTATVPEVQHALLKRILDWAATG